jgi:hypothetical protein
MYLELSQRQLRGTCSTSASGRRRVESVLVSGCLGGFPAYCLVHLETQKKTRGEAASDRFVYCSKAKQRCAGKEFQRKHHPHQD